MISLAESSEGEAKAISYAAATMMEQTDSDGQLAIVDENLSKLSDAFRNLAKAMNHCYHGP